MPLISLIIPIYNSEKYLFRCLDSILSQSFTDFEVLLIDDGSTDKSGDICDNYTKKDFRIKVFHKKNGGVSSARNLGLDNAIGEYVTFIDSDDWIDKDFLNNLFITANFRADLVVGEIQYNNKYNTVVTDNSIVIIDKLMYLKNLFISGFTSVCNIMFKRTFVKNINLRFEPIRYSEDFIFSIKAICLAEQIVYVRDAIYHYDRTNESSALHNYPNDMYKDLLYCDNMMIEFFKEQGLFEDLKREMYWRVLRNKRELVLSTCLHNKFKAIIPEANNYILSCPVINLKMKMMMWFLVHHLDFIVKGFIFLRKVFRR